MLSYIPEDSPYVFAVEKPFPDKLTKKLEANTEELLANARIIIEYALEEELAKQEADGDPDEIAKIQGLMEEVLNIVSLKGLARSALKATR